MKNKSLTPKQKRFVGEYLIDLNATQAAIRSGYSAKRAQEIGWQQLQKTTVQAAIQEAIAERERRTEITQDRVLRELGRIGFSDIRQLFTIDGTLLAPHDWPDDIAAAVSSVEVDELFEGRGEVRVSIGYTRKVKLWEKNSALEKIGKHLKMFTDKLEHTGADGAPIGVTVTFVKP